MPHGACRGSVERSSSSASSNSSTADKAGSITLLCRNRAQQMSANMSNIPITETNVNLISGYIESTRALNGGNGMVAFIRITRFQGACVVSAPAIFADSFSAKLTTSIQDRDTCDSALFRHLNGRQEHALKTRRLSLCPRWPRPNRNGCFQPRPQAGHQPLAVSKSRPWTEHRLRSCRPAHPRAPPAACLQEGPRLAMRTDCLKLQVEGCPSQNATPRVSCASSRSVRCSCLVFYTL